MDRHHRALAPSLTLAAAVTLAIGGGGTESLPLLRQLLRLATVAVHVQAPPAAAPAQVTLGVRG